MPLPNLCCRKIRFDQYNIFVCIFACIVVFRGSYFMKEIENVFPVFA